MNTILIPTCFRAATLFVTLSYLEAARGFENYKIIFAIDRYGHSDDVLRVISDFGKDHPGIEVLKRSQSYGLTRNLLEGYKACFERSDDFVIILEDDIRIAADFFEYIEYCYKNFVNDKTLAITGYSGQNRNDVNSVFRGNHYFSLGTAVLKSKFNEFVLPHCNMEYYFNRNIYLLKNFPGIMTSGGRATHNEQAGLYQRVRKANDLHLITPFTPRAMHFGFYGGNRRSDIEKLSYVEQVKSIIGAIDSPEKLAALEKTNYKDYMNVEDDYSWDKLEVKLI